MDYQTFEPAPDLSPVVKLYWTLKVPAEMAGQKQRVVPDGCLEMVFILGDDIKRHTLDGKTTVQPRAMVLGQITEPFFVEPTGAINSFAVRFFPHSFSCFIKTPIKELTDKETPLAELLGELAAHTLEQAIIRAKSTTERIDIAESFLRSQLHNQATIDELVKTTVDTMLTSKGGLSVKKALQSDNTKRRQLERYFARQVGVSPKQLSKVIRLQTALKAMLNDDTKKLTSVAYESNYYDQAHFIKDFKEFTGITPQEFFESEQMELSTLLYK